MTHYTDKKFKQMTRQERRKYIAGLTLSLTLIALSLVYRIASDSGMIG